MRIISGALRGRKLETLSGYETRPTTDNVKESIFNIILFSVPGSTILDLFAGSGQLGIECLSRGAAKAVFVDQSRAAVDIIRKNLQRCGLKSEVNQTDALTYLNNRNSVLSEAEKSVKEPLLSCKIDARLLGQDWAEGMTFFETLLRQNSESDFVSPNELIEEQFKLEKVTP